MTLPLKSDGDIFTAQEYNVLRNRANAIVDVSDYGAVGDGATDDTVALQAAINAAAGAEIVLIPVGTYRFSSLTLPTGTRLKGFGKQASILKVLDATISGVAIVNADTTLGNDNISLQDFTLDVNATARGVRGDATSDGVRISCADANRCDNILIEGVEVRDTGHVGLFLTNITHAIIQDNLIYDSYRDGINVWFNSSDVVVEGNQVLEAGDDCIAVNSENVGHVGPQAQRIAIVGNVCTHRTSSALGGGIRVLGGIDISIVGNIVRDVFGSGISAIMSVQSSFPSKRITISGNVVDTAGDAASLSNCISVGSGCQEVSIVGNTVSDGYGGGISVSSPCVVANNTIRGGVDANAVGVTALGEGVLIANNVIERSASYGILVSADDVQVIGNRVNGPCQITTAANAIHVSGNINNAIIAENHVIRDGANGARGINIATGAGAGCFVHGNYTEGWSAGNDVSNNGGANVAYALRSGVNVLVSGGMATDAISEATANAGVTIDGLLIKDGGFGGTLQMGGNNINNVAGIFGVGTAGSNTGLSLSAGINGAAEPALGLFTRDSVLWGDTRGGLIQLIAPGSSAPGSVGAAAYLQGGNATSLSASLILGFQTMLVLSGNSVDALAGSVPAVLNKALGLYSFEKLLRSVDKDGIVATVLQDYADSAISGGATATLGGITGGPVGAAQAKWVKVKLTDGTDAYLPAWV